MSFKFEKLIIWQKSMDYAEETNFLSRKLNTIKITKIIYWTATIIIFLESMGMS